MRPFQLSCSVACFVRAQLWKPPSHLARILRDWNPLAPCSLGKAGPTSMPPQLPGGPESWPSRGGEPLTCHTCIPRRGTCSLFNTPCSYRIWSFTAWFLLAFLSISFPATLSGFGIIFPRCFTWHLSSWNLIFLFSGSVYNLLRAIFIICLSSLVLFKLPNLVIRMPQMSKDSVWDSICPSLCGFSQHAGLVFHALI